MCHTWPTGKSVRAVDSPRESVLRALLHDTFSWERKVFNGNKYDLKIDGGAGQFVTFSRQRKSPEKIQNSENLILDSFTNEPRPILFKFHKSSRFLHFATQTKHQTRSPASCIKWVGKRKKTADFNQPHTEKNIRKKAPWLCFPPLSKYFSTFKRMKTTKNKPACKMPSLSRQRQLARKSEFAYLWKICVCVCLLLFLVAICFAKVHRTVRVTRDRFNDE